MITNLIQELSTTTDRHKLYVLSCDAAEISENIEYLQLNKINVINVGKSLAKHIMAMHDYKYLNIELFEFFRTLLDKNKTKLLNSGNDMVAIYNIGILLEPFLKLHAKNLLEEISKSTSIVIIWEYHVVNSYRLNWPSQQNEFFFDFSHTQFKMSAICNTTN